jgi:glutamate synthase domain-containing protein 2
MMRIAFYYASAIVLAAIVGFYFLWPPVLWFLIVVIPLIAVGIWDILSPHNVLSNYPVLGHMRYMLEFISPEIRQYFIETNWSGRPYSRMLRSLIYERAKGTEDTMPFGTQLDIDLEGFEFAYHSIAPETVDESAQRIVVGGPDCLHPYNASRLNISAMSFGALSSNAIMALNKGAKLGNFAHNTGEGGLSPYHLRHGGDIFWQIGTGYFGCRTKDGGFDPEEFKKKARLDNVKMVEIKLSQGAKPAHGGVLPGAKVDAEIANARGVTQGEDCISPPAHRTFSSPEGLLEYVVQLRELSGGKPVGFKLCLGIRSEFLGICKAMLKTGITPDFITVDGAEGGTGAAPVEFSNRLGTTINEALVYVHSALLGVGLRDKMRVIASAKVVTGFDMVTKMSLGADMCNMARPFLFTVGCIQARRCNTNTCPTGVTTQDPRRIRALKVEDKFERVRNFHHATIKSCLDITGAIGVDHPDKLTPELIYHRVLDKPDSHSFMEVAEFLKPGELLGEKIPRRFADDWHRASAESFHPV